MIKASITLPFCLLIVLSLSSCGGASTEAASTDTPAETTAEATEAGMTETTETESEDPKPGRLSPTEKVEQTLGQAKVTIQYGAPSVRERTIWGDLVPYGKVWRTGANEASWIETDQDLMLEGQALPAGKYGLFTLPGEGEWEIIINKVWDQWGAYEYKSSEDQLRVKVTPEALEEKQEQMAITMNDAGQVSIRWDNLAVNFTLAEAAGE